MSETKSLIPVVEDPALTITLRKPVTMGSELVEEIKIREPNALDVIRNGNPVKFDGFSDQFQVAFDEVAVVKMLGALTNGLPRVVFERMNTNDFADLCWAIAPFFVPWVNRGTAPGQTF